MTVAKKIEDATHFVHCNSGDALFVKEADFFQSQGGLADAWGRCWVPVVATSVGDARRQAGWLFGVGVSSIHWGEL